VPGGGDPAGGAVCRQAAAGSGDDRPGDRGRGVIRAVHRRWICGQAKRLQARPEDRDVSYVMAVRYSDTLTTPAGKQRADALIAAVPAAARQDNDQVGTKASYISPSLA
jgi:hypothetical protein